MAQSIVKRGSVVLIRYPFTDLTGAKVRPALVVTPDHLLPRLEDVLCLFISSAMPDDLLPTDFVLEPRHPSFPTTGLKRRSGLRMHKLALLHLVFRHKKCLRPRLKNADRIHHNFRHNISVERASDGHLFSSSS